MRKEMKEEKALNRRDSRNYRLKRKKAIIKLIKTVIVVIIIAVLGMSVKNIFMLTMENKKLEQQYKELSSEKEALEDELKNVNDKDYIEEQARIQLRLIKPGEIIYILQDEKGNDKDSKKDN